MSEDKARIRLKIGELEVECEGETSFLQDDLINLMKKIVDFYAEHKSAIPVSPPPAKGGGGGAKGSSSELDMSTNTIAAHLSASTGPELAIAAAAHLAMVKDKGTFTRQEILDEMKGATTYYNANMSGNLTKSLNTLVKAKRLNQTAKGVYALTASEQTAVEAKLAQ